VIALKFKLLKNFKNKKRVFFSLSLFSLRRPAHVSSPFNATRREILKAVDLFCKTKGSGEIGGANNIEFWIEHENYSNAKNTWPGMYLQTFMTQSKIWMKGQVETKEENDTQRLHGVACSKNKLRWIFMRLPGIKFIECNDVELVFQNSVNDEYWEFGNKSASFKKTTTKEIEFTH
jgi:hypothetical protein